MSEDRIKELRARNHDLANEVMQERAKRMQAEADVAALRHALWMPQDQQGTLYCALCEHRAPAHYNHCATIRHDAGATLLAVAQAAAAFVEAGEYDDLASLLLELKEAVKEWKR